ncbi:MAG TPA: BatD family protein, partial [Nannocystaceae bacterium]|nr:BatD family protein [Nannocystaceae bacterium]
MATRRRFLTIAAGAATAALTGTARAADGLRAQIAVDRERMSVGEELQIELVVTRTGSGSVPDPALPPALADAFEVVSQFTSTSARTTWGSGGSSRSVSATTNIGAVALVPGKHTLVFTVDD